MKLTKFLIFLILIVELTPKTTEFDTQHNSTPFTNSTISYYTTEETQFGWKIYTDPKSLQIYSNIQLGTDPRWRKVQLKTEEYWTYMECFGCKDNHVQQKNCYKFDKEVYDIHASRTGKIPNCREK